MKRLVQLTPFSYAAGVPVGGGDATTKPLIRSTADIHENLPDSPESLVETKWVEIDTNGEVENYHSNANNDDDGVMSDKHRGAGGDNFDPTSFTERQYGPSDHSVANSAREVDLSVNRDAGRSNVGLQKDGESVQFDMGHLKVAQAAWEDRLRTRRQHQEERRQCAALTLHLPNVEFSNYNVDANRRCTLKCVDTTHSSFQLQIHTCVVQEDEFVNGKPKVDENGNVVKKWHFGHWYRNQCLVTYDPDAQFGQHFEPNSDSVAANVEGWFYHDGCSQRNIAEGHSNKALCLGCFRGCKLPVKTIEYSSIVVYRDLFKNDEKVTLECVPNHCWSGGVVKRELSAACFCDQDDCRFGICSNGICEKSPVSGAESLVQQGCVYCEGGRCIRPVNARLCNKNANLFPGQEECPLAIDQRKALYQDLTSTDAQDYDFFKCAEFRTLASKPIAEGGKAGEVEVVDVKRCWKDGRSGILKAQCNCYKDAESCEFRELTIDGTDGGRPDVFREGCLVEYCLPPNASLLEED